MQSGVFKKIKLEQLTQQVTKVLDSFFHPTLLNNLSTLRSLYHCVLLNNVLHIELIMPFTWNTPFKCLIEQKTSQLRTMTGVQAVEWKLRHNINTLQRVNNLPGVNGVRNIISVSSGKGGVGKSTTTVNLALALAQEGAKVGILDADIYGPSIPTMLSTQDQQPIISSDGYHMLPIIAYGMATNSIGYLVNNDNAMIWRGPMASKALMQMLNDTKWPDLDYLVIDMPSGTGDIQLTLSQNIPVTAAVIVTTPQDIALLDVIKGIAMFDKVKVPVLGIVENMNLYICSNCGHLESIFGSGGAEMLVNKYKCKLLGKLPLHISLREDLDQGQPTVIRDPNGKFANIYREIASTISAQMYWTIGKIPSAIAVQAI